MERKGERSARPTHQMNIDQCDFYGKSLHNSTQIQYNSLCYLDTKVLFDSQFSQTFFFVYVSYFWTVCWPRLPTNWRRISFVKKVISHDEIMTWIVSWKVKRLTKSWGSCEDASPGHWILGLVKDTCNNSLPSGSFVLQARPLRLVTQGEIVADFPHRGRCFVVQDGVCHVSGGARL